jgi:hypothetical protein
MRGIKNMAREYSLLTLFTVANCCDDGGSGELYNNFCGESGNILKKDIYFIEY